MKQVAALSTPSYAVERGETRYIGGWNRLLSVFSGMKQVAALLVNVSTSVGYNEV